MSTYRKIRADKVVVPFVAGWLPSTGEAHIISEPGRTPAQNIANLANAIDRAKALTPYGEALSATNRATVVMLPGRYGAGAILLDAEFVDITGLSGDPRDVVLEDGFVVNANDICLRGFSGACRYHTGGGQSHDGGAKGRFVDIDAGDRESQFNLANGTYIRCRAGDYAFGGGDVGGEAAGTFIDCIGGTESFGVYAPASGTFIRCIAGDDSFGTGVSDPPHDGATGYFEDCKVVTDVHSGGIGFGANTAAAGVFVRCEALSGGSFGNTGAGVLTGQLYNCRVKSGTGYRTPTGSGAVVLCIAGDNTVVTAYPE